MIGLEVRGFVTNIVRRAFAGIILVMYLVEKKIWIKDVLIRQRYIMRKE